MLTMPTIRPLIDQVAIRHALVSVSNKSELESLIRGLSDLKAPITLFSTGGTYRTIEGELAAGGSLTLRAVEDYTAYPEMPGGLVKTLHPRIHGGLLAELDHDPQVEFLEAHGIVPFDLVVVNLYPFEQTIARAGVSLEEARQNIDIGGPTMLRAAAKNFLRVATVCDPADYEPLVDELRRCGGMVSFETRWRLAQKAFRHVLDYDRAIAEYLSGLTPDEAMRSYCLA